MRRARPTPATKQARAQGERNQTHDTNTESYSLQRFLDLVLKGQPIALEMLFAPDTAMAEPPELV